MQCPVCSNIIGSGEKVFQRIGLGVMEWVCSKDCCEKSDPQGEFWSSWKPAVCVETEVCLVEVSLILKASSIQKLSEEG